MKLMAMHNSIYSSLEEYFCEIGINNINEATLIHIVDQAEEMTVVYFATVLLRKYGSMAAIPSLQKAMYYPKQDVKIASLYTIAHIAKEQGNKFYIFALQDKNYREKSVAICAIADYGDESAIEAVIGRVKKILAMKKRPTLQIDNRGTELSIAISYLKKYVKTHQEVDRFFREIAPCVYGIAKDDYREACPSSIN
jgi:HEAT repeat protein